MNSSSDNIEHLDLFLGRLDDRGHRWREGQPGKYRFQCPNHDDQRESGTLEVGRDGGLVLYCHAGCESDDVLASLGLREADLYPAPASRAEQAAARRAERRARDRASALAANTALLSQIWEADRWPQYALQAFNVGLDPRTRLVFNWTDPSRNPRGLTFYTPRHLRGWIDGPAKLMESGGKHGVMFPSQRPSTGPLAVVEGGAAAIAAYTCGLNPIAISSAGFRPPASWASPLVRNREVKVLHDADSAGRGAASRLADWALKGGASSVAIVDLYPELHHGEDIADLLRAVGREEAVAYLHRSIDQADVMENAPRSRGRPPSSIKQAEEYLRGVLSDGQWHSSKSVDENSPDEVSPRTLSRARRNLGVTSQQKNREWWLRIQPP